ncbi:hypothetical protein MiSe_94820 [Microseira wollei NIES-4236]|uniref:Uncharacterized protein n=1 Tax=Microseira wollei NIES-4236 TaxID=2530354 RepID=A0AAV3XTJ9_9CYAN|nr:hypothetical protein MiSe_94820 [Microseira wollei NIES-4236]
MQPLYGVIWWPPKPYPKPLPQPQPCPEPIEPIYQALYGVVIEPIEPYPPAQAEYGVVIIDPNQY